MVRPAPKIDAPKQMIMICESRPGTSLENNIMLIPAAARVASRKTNVGVRMINCGIR